MCVWSFRCDCGEWLGGMYYEPYRGWALRATDLDALAPLERALADRDRSESVQTLYDEHVASKKLDLWSCPNCELLYMFHDDVQTFEERLDFDRDRLLKFSSPYPDPNLVFDWPLPEWTDDELELECSCGETTEWTGAARIGMALVEGHRFRRFDDHVVARCHEIAAGKLVGPPDGSTLSAHIAAFAMKHLQVAWGCRCGELYVQAGAGLRRFVPYTACQEPGVFYRRFPDRYDMPIE